jgi:hypothetical protein
MFFNFFSINFEAMCVLTDCNICKHMQRLTLRFDEVESRDVALDDGGRCARFGDLLTHTAGQYPDPNCNAAYVHAGHTLAALHSSALTLAVVHFRIDCDPSTHFVPTQQPLSRSQR